MRNDIIKLISSIVLSETIEKFGSPVNNKSKVIVICSSCKTCRDVQISALKQAYRVNGTYLCPSCGTKKSWTKERKEKEKITRNSIYNKKLLSERSKKLWENTDYREKVIEKINNNYGDGTLKKKLSQLAKENYTEKRRKHQSDVSKKLWKDSNYRNKQNSFRTHDYKVQASLKMKEVWKNPDYKENASSKAKKLWENDEFRKNISNKMKEVWKNPEFKVQASLRMKEVWKNPNFRSFYEKLWDDEVYKMNLSKQTSLGMEKNKESVSKAAKTRWENPVYRENIISKLKITWSDKDRLKKASKKSKEILSRPDIIDKMAVSRKNQSGKMSSIEKITLNILKSLGVSFVSQKQVGFYHFDFYLEDFNVYIECQGEYWHSLPGRESRDQSKKTYLMKVNPLSKILYLYERDFLNPLLIRRKIEDFLQLTDLKQVSFEFSNTNLTTIDKNMSKEFFDSFHYAGYGRSAKRIYGVLLNNTLISACKISSPIRKESVTSMGYKFDEIVEIDRFCIHPNYQKKNFASWFISRVIKEEFKDSYIKGIISYADSTYDHTGIIYKAANFKLISTIKPDYYYINEEGFLMNKKTLYNRAVRMSMKEKEYAKKFGYEKKIGKEKYKYSFIK